MLKINNLSKSFVDKEAIKNINLTVNKGSILGLVGPNGAGKSTLLRTIVDIYTPDTGSVTLDGENIEDNPSIKERIGYMGDRTDYFNKWKIKHIVKHYKFTYVNFDEEKFNKINEVFQIPLNKKVTKLSKGNISRLFFMLTLSSNPDLLILDEPTSGLDPIVKRKLLKILVDDVFERETTVIISSHNLSDLESICDHIVFINDGEIIKDNSLDTLKTDMKKLQIIFKENAPENFEHWKEFLHVDKIGRSFNAITNCCNEELMNKLKENGALFIEELDMSLEDMLVYTIEH